MSLPPFVLVTGNPNKSREVERILGFRPETAAIDLPEVQSLDILEVLEAKGEAAWALLGRPLVVEETGFCLAAMGGFPGPLVKWMLQAMGPAGIAQAAHRLGNTRASAHCALLFRDASGSAHAEGVAEGSLVLEGRGKRGFGWDPFFVPAGRTKTYAELSDVSKDRLGHRGKAWRALMKIL